MSLASPLFCERIEIAGELEVLTPLHVGSGDHEPDEALGKGGNELPPATARLQIDARGFPFIPGSSLKGALRALLAGRNAADVAALLGPEPGEGDRTMGSLLLFGAPLAFAPKSSLLPLYDKKQAKRRGAAISARTAIDKGRGTADRNKLFHAEEVAPGARFRFRARFVEPREAAQARAQLADLLATLRSERGVALGRGRGDGAGRVRLKDVTITRRRVDPAKDGFAAAGEDRDLLRGGTIPPAGEAHRLRLTCDGPFFVNDWSYERTPDKKDEPHLKFMKAAGGAPALPATSLMGALRSRAAWLAARDNLRAGDIETLFGSADRAGRLTVEAIDCTHRGVEARPTSVRIDRFSGAPMEGALFEAQCVFDPAFEAHLRFAPPEGHGAAGRALLDKLIADVTDGGLRLGHAGNRGFGWFTVTWERRP
jgi:CRISPR/Cas system CSM-associated protein Csm3 (group 7 of RAMP superfamily)